MRLPRVSAVHMGYGFAPTRLDSPAADPYNPVVTPPQEPRMSRPRSRVAWLTFAAATLVLVPVGASAQEKRVDSLLTVDKYLDFEQVAEPRVSPDGSQIIYTRRWVNKLED